MAISVADDAGLEVLQVIRATGAQLSLRRQSAPRSFRDESFGIPALITALAFSPSGHVAVLACADGVIRGLDVRTGAAAWTLPAGPAALAVAALGDRGPIVAVLPDGTMPCYDLQTRMRTGLLRPTPEAWTMLAVADGAVLAAGPHDRLLRWRPGSGSPHEVRSTGLPVTVIAGDSSGRVLIGSADGRLWRYDFSTARTIELPGRGTTDESEVTAALPVTSDGPTRSGPGDRGLLDEDVRFTVYRQQVLTPGVWASMLVFAHKTTRVEEPGRPPVDPLAQVQEMARAHFGAAPPAPLAADAGTGVFRGARLRVVPELPGIQSNPPEAEFDWWEPVHQVAFRLSAGPSLVGSVVRGAVRVWCGPLLIGEVFLAVRVAATEIKGADLAADSARRYLKVFPSYSRADRQIVAGFAEVVQAIGGQYLQDVLALRSGERWAPRLLELIEEADVFQLFWSTNSMRSRHCRDEWEHALSLQKPSFIKPVYWEDPLPREPTLGLPPTGLRELHFMKLRTHRPPTGSRDAPRTAEAAPDQRPGAGTDRTVPGFTIRRGSPVRQRGDVGPGYGPPTWSGQSRPRPPTRGTKPTSSAPGGAASGGGAWWEAAPANTPNDGQYPAAQGAGWTMTPPSERAPLQTAPPGRGPVQRQSRRMVLVAVVVVGVIVALILLAAFHVFS